MSTFAKNSFWTIFSQGVIFVAGLGTSIIISRILNPEGKGIYTLALFLPSFLMYFANVNIGAAGVFNIANRRYPPKIVLGNNLICVSGHGIIAVLMGMMVIYFFSEQLFPGVPVEYLVLALLIVPGYLFIGFVLPLLLGSQKIKAYNVFQVLNSILLLGLIIVFVAVLHMGVPGGIISGAVAAYVTSIVLFFVVSRETGGISFRIEKGYLKDAYQYGGKLYIGGALSFLNLRFNVVLLNLYMNSAMVGFFGLASGLSEKVWLVADAIGTVLFPKIASEKDRGKRNSFSLPVFKVTLLIVALIAVFLYVVGERLIVLLYSTQFLESVRPFRFLLVGVVASSGWRILENDLMGRGRPGFITIVIAVSCATNILLSIVLIPRYGLMGASWAVVTSAVTSLLLGSAFFCKVSGNVITDLVVFTRSDVKACQGLVFSVLRRLKLGVT